MKMHAEPRCLLPDIFPGSAGVRPDKIAFSLGTTGFPVMEDRDDSVDISKAKCYPVRWQIKMKGAFHEN
jgi:hypothetical protein